jgi:hypothetical protein
MKWVMIYIFGLSAHASPSDPGVDRFQALSRARTVTEFESIKRRFDLLEAAALACEKEKASGRVPVNCYVVLKIKKAPPSVTLNNLCEEAASRALHFVHREHLRLLPEGCARRLKARERMLAYKAGKDFE